MTAETVALLVLSFVAAVGVVVVRRLTRAVRDLSARVAVTERQTGRPPRPLSRLDRLRAELADFRESAPSAAETVPNQPHNRG